jgi:hypothetical protein
MPQQVSLALDIWISHLQSRLVLIIVIRKSRAVGDSPGSVYIPRIFHTVALQLPCACQDSKYRGTETTLEIKGRSSVLGSCSEFTPRSISRRYFRSQSGPGQCEQNFGVLPTASPHPFSPTLPPNTCSVCPTAKFWCKNPFRKAY